MDRAGQVAEVVEGRARGCLWGKNPSCAIPTVPVLGTSILAKYIRTSVLLNMHISSTASTAQHSTDSAITLEQSSKPSMCRSEYISKEESNVRTFNMHAALFSRSMELLAFAEVAGLHLKC